MTAQPSRWGDLRPRIVSAVAMLALGAFGIWMGGLWFHLLLSVVSALMVWELALMLDPAMAGRAIGLAAAGGLGVFLASYAPGAATLPLLLAPALVGFSLLAKARVTFAIYCSAALFAAFALIALRDVSGIVWMTWLIAVVVVVDVAGYFAGRMIGGPKFWPKISPKKTWSGTVAGWIGAAIVGAIAMRFAGGGALVIGMSVACALAAQLGDIAESAIKRRAEVKDSSALIPGHGGVLDRFDGMIGAALLLLIVGQVLAFPPQ